VTKPKAINNKVGRFCFAHLQRKRINCPGDLSISGMQLRIPEKTVKLRDGGWFIVSLFQKSPVESSGKTVRL